jgi:hypothetical protein
MNSPVVRRTPLEEEEEGMINHPALHDDFFTNHRPPFLVLYNKFAANLSNSYKNAFGFML